MMHLEKLRLRFWLAAMDVIDDLGVRVDKVLSRAYLFAVARASDATDWGKPSAEQDWRSRGCP